MVVNDKNNPKESIVKLNTNPLGGRISLSVKIMGAVLFPVSKNNWFGRAFVLVIERKRVSPVLENHHPIILWYRYSKKSADDDAMKQDPRCEISILYHSTKK